MTDDWHLFWVYVLGPCAGSATAALLHRFATRLEAETGKLFHDLHYRSIFKGAADHAANECVRGYTARTPLTRPPLHRATIEWN